MTAFSILILIGALCVFTFVHANEDSGKIMFCIHLILYKYEFIQRTATLCCQLMEQGTVPAYFISVASVAATIPIVRRAWLAIMPSLATCAWHLVTRWARYLDLENKQLVRACKFCRIDKPSTKNCLLCSKITFWYCENIKCFFQK